MKSKFYLLLVIIFVSLFSFVSCNNQDPTPEEPTCNHESTYSVWEEGAKCEAYNSKFYYCSTCGELLDVKQEYKEHEYEYTKKEVTCEEDGYLITMCKNCTLYTKEEYKATGHNYEYVIDQEPGDGVCGIKHKECSNCHDKEDNIYFLNNDFATHGALHVDGTDLMDSSNNKFRLVGVSTFGLQWQPQYVNEQTFANLKDEFGANVVRLAMYTAEDGYCTANATKKEELYQTVCNGIEIATKLNLYVIVDWHMLGADESCIEDENPLHFKNEAMEFFDRITKQYAGYDNILFEIMNEPSGSATWADCKEYAEAVIPVIRNNMPNAIVLVGNPQWSSDLESVANDPLTGFDNIMYTFHFYANDNCLTNKITKAVSVNKLPVFITEHGGMDASGYGAINYTSLTKWYQVLDQYNISFIAWSLSNLNSSSCMFKTGSTDIYSFKDDNLKGWGIYYKKRVRTVMGLPVE